MNRGKKKLDRLGEQKKLRGQDKNGGHKFGTAWASDGKITRRGRLNPMQSNVAMKVNWV